VKIDSYSTTVNPSLRRSYLTLQQRWFHHVCTQLYYRQPTEHTTSATITTTLLCELVMASKVAHACSPFHHAEIHSTTAQAKRSTYILQELFPCVIYM